jgi:hypothetical protein
MTQGEGGWRGVRVERRFLIPIGLWNVLCEWSAVVTAHLLLQSSHAIFSPSAIRVPPCHVLLSCKLAPPQGVKVSNVQIANVPCTGL